MALKFLSFLLASLCSLPTDLLQSEVNFLLEICILHITNLRACNCALNIECVCWHDGRRPHVAPLFVATHAAYIRHDCNRDASRLAKQASTHLSVRSRLTCRDAVIVDSLEPHTEGACSFTLGFKQTLPSQFLHCNLFHRIGACQQQAKMWIHGATTMGCSKCG